MKLERGLARTLVLLLGNLVLAACSYNPFLSDNHTTGSVVGTAIGAGAGAGTIALLGGTKPYVILGGIGGGAIGYYLTTLRADSSGIIQAQGKVYVMGDYLGIYIPSDHLFEPNTAEFLPQAHYALDSVIDVLNRKPENNIMISGNTSGFYKSRWEQSISQRRAKAIAAYLWSYGIVQFKPASSETRKLSYVGYGNYFPISSDLTNDGIRENSRIQITSYPSYAMLHEKCRKINTDNVAGMDDAAAGDCVTIAKDACGRDDKSC